jgi:hypothetical protein
MPEAGALEPDKYSIGLGFDSATDFTSFTAAAAAAITGSIGLPSCFVSSQLPEGMKDHGGNEVPHDMTFLILL